jgi:hypothetical protein
MVREARARRMVSVNFMFEVAEKRRRIFSWNNETQEVSILYVPSVSLSGFLSLFNPLSTNR